jgi:Fic family protein
VAVGIDLFNLKILPVAEVRTHFSSVLKEVESGKEIGISFGRKKETIDSISIFSKENIRVIHHNSMSTQIETERNEYYRRLEEQQSGGVDLTRWLQWFLGCLDRSFDRAEAIQDHILYKARIRRAMSTWPANERQ